MFNDVGAIPIPSGVMLSKPIQTLEHFSEVCFQIISLDTNQMVH